MQTAVEVWNWRGPDDGPTGAFSRGLAVAPARVLPGRLLSSPARLLPGVLWSSLAGIPPGVIIFYSVNLILNVFTKICIPPQRCLPSPGPMWLMVFGDLGSRVARSVGVGRAASASVLLGLPRLLRQGSCWGNLHRPSALCGLGLGVASVVLCLRVPSGFPPLVY